MHIAPGATLAGSVAIGQGTLVGAGANVLPGISVASNAIVGAGAVVIDDAADPAVYVGVPARKVERR
ncbi:UDP-N-acetylbacillosamine N-acetyltransferase [compost metagenome]